MIRGDSSNPDERRQRLDVAEETVWYVYLVRCADMTLYCGVTTDVRLRLLQHNGKRSGGARYTRGRRPVQLVAVRPCSGRAEALQIEYAIKRCPRERKIERLLEQAEICR